MKNISSALGFGLALATLSTACATGTGGTATTGDAAPYLEEWDEVINTSFPLETVNTITIGRKELNENFANRGDVEVIFDQATETIVVEMRKYAFQADQSEADAAFAKLSIWAYSTTSSPEKPSDMDPADNCEAGWQNDCKIHVYYDGQAQPVRSGADLRVHLPIAYRKTLNIQTEDNTSEDSYKLRGDVTVKDLCGNATIQMSSGVAKVRMCSDLQEGPTCSAADIAACEEQSWDSGCPCTNFGLLKITALDPWAANITVDFPSDDVWANVSMENTVAGSDCVASFDNCTGANCTLEQSQENTAKGKAEYNYPGLPATPGVGFAINLESNGCETVLYADSPSDHIPGEPDSPLSEKRGNLNVCTGCLSDI